MRKQPAVWFNGCEFSLRFVLIAVFVFVFFPASAGAQDIEINHERLLDAQLARIETNPAGPARLYVIAAGLSSKQDVFRNDADTVRDLLDKYWGTANRSIVLSAHPGSRDQMAYPTRRNLRAAAEQIGLRMNPKDDVLLVFLSSHGSESGRSLEVSPPEARPFFVSGVDVRQMFEHAGAKWRVVILSACHAGSLIDQLRDENTLVIAAAHATRSSFGCSYEHLHTWFTEAFVEALTEVQSFEQAFTLAVRKIQAREEGGLAHEYSMPQIYIGAAIRAKLREIEAQAKRPTDWEPPVHFTESGRARRLLGDYLATAKNAGGQTDVYWLRLDAAAAAQDGKYPIKGNLQQYYRRTGKVELSYSLPERGLSGGSPEMGELRLKVGQTRFSGVFTAPGATAPIALEFAKVSRREVIETAAMFPPRDRRAKPSSTIRLFYMSAEDCSYCRKWERDHLAARKLTDMPEYKQIEFIKISRFTLKDHLKRNDFPQDLARFYDMFAKNSAMQRMLSISPSFALMVDEEVRTWTTGGFLDSPIYPMLRAAVREKQADTVRAPPASAWKVVPEVVVISPQGDPRRILVDEALEFWNEVFARIETPFRFGKARHIAGAVSEKYLAGLSEAVISGSAHPERPEEVRRWGQRLVIATSESPIVSFAARLTDQRGWLIGLRSLNAAPMGRPNVARNVAAHEIGHALGLGHGSDFSMLMCGRPAPCRPDVFQSGDRKFFPLSDDELATLRRMYPKDWKPSD